MPYPINTLPYPFKKRLRQLLTPVELHQLQKATGPLDENHHLLPLMKVQKCNYLYSNTTSDNELVVWYYDYGPRNYITDASPYVYQPQDMAVLEKLHESHLSDPKFHHILFEGLIHLKFRDTVISESLLLAFKEKKIGVTQGFETHGPLQEQYPADFHPLCAFFAAFPAVTCCLYPCSAYEGWLQDLLKLKKYDLDNFVIESDNFKKLFSFHPQEMQKFIKRQSKHNDEFTLSVLYKVDDITQTELERIDSFFYPYFEYDNGIENCNLRLSISTSNARKYYVYKLKMRSVSVYSFANLVRFFNFRPRRVDCNDYLDL